MLHFLPLQVIFLMVVMCYFAFAFHRFSQGQYSYISRILIFFLRVWYHCCRIAIFKLLTLFEEIWRLPLRGWHFLVDLFLTFIRGLSYLYYLISIKNHKNLPILFTLLLVWRYWDIFSRHLKQLQSPSGTSVIFKH